MRSAPICVKADKYKETKATKAWVRLGFLISASSLPFVKHHNSIGEPAIRER
jgi:hypothetical protein